MKIEEMRKVHEAATGGEWVGVDVAWVSTADGRFNVADCAMDCDAEAIVMYHNKFGKLLDLAEAAQGFMTGSGVHDEVWLNTLSAALAALEEP